MRGPSSIRECLLAGTILFASTSRAKPITIFERASSTCPTSNSTQCIGDGLPSDFCCTSGTSCLVLASNTTVLCCPEGQTCDVIATVTCDITQQNVSLHPDTSLMTTNLTATLETCGSKCCPLGYSCNSESNCALVVDTSSGSSTTTATSASPTATTMSLGAAGSATTTSAAAVATSSETSTSSSGHSSFSVGILLAGLIPGLVVGIIITIATLCYIGKRKQRKEMQEAEEKRPDTSSSFGCSGGGTTLISEPIYMSSNSALRTDFLRHPPNQSQSQSNRGPSLRSPGQPETPTPMRDPAIQRGTLFRESTASQLSGNTDIEDNSPTSPINGTMPSSMPPLQTVPRPQNPHINHPREPSTASINVGLEDFTHNGLRISFLTSPTGYDEFEPVQPSAGVNGARNLLLRPDPLTSRDMRSSHNTTFSDMMNRDDDPFTSRDRFAGGGANNSRGLRPARTPPGMM